MAILQTVPDAQYIVEAELYGTEKPVQGQPRETLVNGIKAARDLIQQAKAIIEGLPLGTVWEDKLEKLYGDAERLETAADDLATEIK